jgi:hypothetical protein
MSIYTKRKRMFAGQLRRAHAELEEFRADLPVRFGMIAAAAIRQAAWFRDSGIHGGTAEMSDDAIQAIETILVLKRQVRAACRLIHTSDCWFHEGPHGISVWETLGMSWDDVWRMVNADRRLPVSAVLRLLNVVRTTEQVMPTKEQIGKWAINVSVESWWRLLRRRHRRLLHLLQTAAEQEQELRWDSPP